MRNLKFWLLISLCSINCTKVNAQEDLGAEICKCIYANYMIAGVDFKTELLKFEQYLIKSKILVDSTGQSYLLLFKTITENNKMPFVRDYSIDSFKPKDYKLYNDCFKHDVKSLPITEANSKLLHLYSTYLTIRGPNDPRLSNVSEAVIKILQPEDFDIEFYRINALHYLYWGSLRKSTRSE